MSPAESRRIGCWRVSIETPILLFLSPLVTINGSNAAGDPLGGSLHNTIRNTTFEVVLKKPESDPLTYEKALPTERHQVFTASLQHRMPLECLTENCRSVYLSDPYTLSPLHCMRWLC
jgi:hypothetical protein